MAIENVGERLDLFLDKPLHPIEFFLKVWVGFEVPGH
jgi:hypothetical protein